MATKTKKETKSIQAPGVTSNENGTVTIRLNKPIKRGEQEFPSITLLEPKAKDFVGIPIAQVDSGEAGSVTLFVSKINSEMITKEELLDLNARDFLLLVLACKEFLEV